MHENNKEEFSYKELYDTVRAEVSESRSFFEKLYKYSLGSLVFIAVVGVGTFTWFVGQKYNDIEESIAKKTDKQIEILQQDIRKRIEEEFKTENMKAIIQSVAREQTKSGLSEVINKVVAAQVQVSIKGEGPRIQQTVIAETKKSVSELSPIIEKSVKEKASDTEKRIQNRIAQWEDLIKASNLAILARNGDGKAYDNLIALTDSTKNDQIRSIGFSTYRQIYLEMNSGLYMGRHFITKKTESELIKFMEDENSFNRKAAIDGLVELRNKTIIPKLLNIAESDPDMMVRHAAFNGLATLSGEKIDALLIDQWRAWWDKNKQSWPPKK